MEKISTLFLSMSFAYTLTAQTTFQKTYGGSDDEGMYGFTKTQTGEFLMAGQTESFNGDQFDIYLIKAAEDGNIIWSKVYRGLSNENAIEVKETADHGFIIAGGTASFGAGNEDALLMKIDSAGNLLWSKVYGGSQHDFFYSVAQTFDGGYIAAGNTLSSGAGNTDIFIVRTDDQGDTLWTRIIGGTSLDESTRIIQTRDSSFILIGKTLSFGSTFIKVFLSRFNAIGDTLWSIQFGGIGQEDGQGVIETNDGDYVVVASVNDFVSNNWDWYLNRFDVSGNLLWSKIYGGQKVEFAYEVVNMTNSGFAVVGYTESFGEGHRGTDSSNVLLIRTDANGDTLWTHTYGGEKMDEVFGLVKTNDEGLAILAFSSSFGTDSLDAYLIKTDALGNSYCHETRCSPFVHTANTMVSHVSPQIISGTSVALAPFTVINPPTFQNTLCFDVGISTVEPWQKKITLFPNPASAEINFYLTASMEAGTIDITNVLRQSVLKKNFSGQKSAVNISSLPAGIYFFIARDEKNITAAGKFVKE